MQRKPAWEMRSPRNERTVSRRVALLTAGAALALIGCGDRNPQTQRPEPGKSAERIYFEHRVVATMFWIGEPASADNANITNTVTAWDSDPITRFGGIDDPASPPEQVNHNRYYFALPVAENNQTRAESPWHGETIGENESLFKGRWIQVADTASGRVIYAQWLDTGPCATTECNDPHYVFGNDRPKNDFGLKAGLNLSPTAMAELGADGSAEVMWKFINALDVPKGPWLNDPLITNGIY